MMAEAAEVSGGDVEERGYVAEGEEFEEVGIAGEEFVVALFRSLRVQVHKTVVDGGEDHAGRLLYFLPQVGIRLHSFGNPRRRDAVDLAGSCGDDRTSGLLTVKREREVADKLSGKLETDNMWSAIRRITFILQRSRLDISYVSTHSSGRYELLSPIKVTQFTLPDTEVTPVFRVDVIYIRVEL